MNPLVLDRLKTSQSNIQNKYSDNNLFRKYIDSNNNISGNNQDRDFRDEVGDSDSENNELTISILIRDCDFISVLNPHCFLLT
jgi:hypothetical protein